MVARRSPSIATAIPRSKSLFSTMHVSSSKIKRRNGARVFHRADNRPRYHDGRGGHCGRFSFRGVTRFANSIPARIDLQVCGNDARLSLRVMIVGESAQGRCCCGGRVARCRSHQRPARPPYIFLVEQRPLKSSPRLPDLTRPCQSRHSTFHSPIVPSEGRLSRINGYIGLRPHRGVVQCDGITRLFQQ